MISLGPDGSAARLRITPIVPWTTSLGHVRQASDVSIPRTKAPHGPAVGWPGGFWPANAAVLD